MNNYLIPIDKANHFIVGTIIFSLSTFILTPIMSFLPVILIAGAKECYDYYSGNGTPDVEDFLYTILGAIPVFITLI